MIQQKQSEKKTEAYLREQVKKRGGIAFKFTSPNASGVPDRIVLIPKGKIYFVELKSEGMKLTALQEAMKRVLEKLGFKVYVIDTKEKVNEFLNEVFSA